MRCCDGKLAATPPPSHACSRQNAEVEPHPVFSKPLELKRTRVRSDHPILEKEAVNTCRDGIPVLQARKKAKPMLVHVTTAVASAYSFQAFWNRPCRASFKNSTDTGTSCSRGGLCRLSLKTCNARTRDGGCDSCNRRRFVAKSVAKVVLMPFMRHLAATSKE